MQKTPFKQVLMNNRITDKHFDNGFTNAYLIARLNIKVLVPTIKKLDTKRYTQSYIDGFFAGAKSYFEDSCEKAIDGLDMLKETVSLNNQKQIKK